MHCQFLLTRHFQHGRALPFSIDESAFQAIGFLTAVVSATPVIHPSHLTVRKGR
jgi:hypothetical protein